eukprot:scaffold4103_cov131-Skeletonema_menzelii.AAC.1
MVLPQPRLFVRAHQAAVDATKSTQMDEAEVALQNLCKAGLAIIQASSKLELDLNSQLSRAKQSYPHPK